MVRFSVRHAPAFIVGLTASLCCAHSAIPPVVTGMVFRNVSFVDLDLTSPAGQRALEHRIFLAARQVCVEVSNAPVDSDAFTNCITAARYEAQRLADARIASAVATRSQIAAANQ